MILYENQAEGLKKIKNSLKECNVDITIHVRVHPNSKNTNPQFFNDILELNSSNFNIIMPDSDVSSYRMMECSDKIITFGSTIGIEASYWNKISINIGRSFYEKLGVSYSPINHDEVLELILSENLVVQENINIYKYGFYHVESGEQFKYYQPKDNQKGLYNGVDLHKYNFTRIERIKDLIRDYIPDFLLKTYRKLKCVKF